MKASICKEKKYKDYLKIESEDKDEAIFLSKWFGKEPYKNLISVIQYLPSFEQRFKNLKKNWFISEIKENKK